MKNKTIIEIVTIAALLAASPALAQSRKTVANLPTAACAAGNIENRVFIVTDADNLADCSSGDGTSAALCICDGGSFVSLSGTTVADMAGSYVLITKAGQQSVTASGAGNDVALVAADDVLLTPTDALTAAVGGAAAITTTAGAITLTAGGTTQDISLISVDDIILTPTDDLTVNPTGLVNIIPGESFAVTTTAGAVTLTAAGAGNDVSLIGPDDLIFTGADFLPTLTGTSVLVAPVQTFTATTSILATTPKLSVSGHYEYGVTNVTVADDAAGTKPAGVTPITTPIATCTCNDATGCTMSVAEPTVTAGYGRMLTIVSIGTGNCEYADSAGVTEIGSALVLEPTSTAVLAYANAAWHLVSTADNVP